MSKQLEQAWDKLTVAVFLGSNRAFYGSLLCSLQIKWDDTINTAMVNPDLGIRWNPDFFTNLEPDSRLFVLVHELEHVARLHLLRKGNRDAEKWNVACDYEINQCLYKEGYTSKGITPLYNEAFDDMTAEEIYDLLPDSPSASSFGDGLDMEPGDASQEQLTNILNSVVKAVQASKALGCSTDKTNAIEDLLTRFLAPQVEWPKVLKNYLTEKFAKSLSWKRPSKYYDEFYAPARVKQTGALTHINFYLDTSGSITDEMVAVFNSEVRHIHKQYSPKKLSLIQFDTAIRHEYVYRQNQRIKEMAVIGRGGTDLVCVRDHIIKHRPKIVIILTDLECTPMEPIHGVDILWVVFNNPSAQVNQGKVVHVNTL